MLLAATIVSLSSIIQRNETYAGQPAITPTRGESAIYSIIDGTVTGNDYNFKTTDGTNTYTGIEVTEGQTLNLDSVV